MTYRREASEVLAQQFIEGGVIPGQLVGQNAVSKKYVDDQLALRDEAIADAESSAAQAQADIDNHEASTTAHPAQHITYSGAAPGANVKQGIDNTYTRISEIVAQAGDDNTEIVDARAGYPVLGDRLNASDAQLADLAINVKAYGAIGDGVADDTTAIQAAITDAYNSGRGLVFLPAGVYIVTGIQYRSNITIKGAGVGATVVKLKDNTPNTSVFNCTPEVSDVCIRDLTIDGNRNNQTVYGHGIRSGTEGGIIGGLFFNLHIKNTGAYGIGFQKGTFKNVRLENITTENTGLDGIDIKNISNNNDIIFCDNITVINPGRDLSQTVQAGVDCRGPVVLSNIIVRGLDRDQTGIRFRPSGETTGIGGGKSSLTNFSVYGTGAKSGTVGVATGDPDVRISNGYVYNTDYGIITESTAFRVQIDNIEIDTANVNGAQFVSEYVKIRGSIVRNSVSNGIRVGASNVEIKDTTIIGSGLQAVRLLAGFTDISLVGNDLRGNPGVALRDDGATYTARNNKGWITEANLISADIDCSTVGAKTTTIAHGLSVTPSLQDIILTPIITGGASYVIDNVGVVSVNGSNITVRINVATAQASGVCKIAAQIRAKI
ncbi:glycosyl hydrolase family 28-related protein [Paenibacillus senegalimassiliensis]|uniref:glycosyl hydrolase family 28-related protein n=1 Tax=Paenibacillus senegalimassiliensis TaxID=1737426 RepID=UPI00073EE45D|nr:glycosyl hydrolase family 28-related protein [Paenibacillus senegalimassiliensis]